MRKKKNGRKIKIPGKKDLTSNPQQGFSVVKAAMFVPYTPHSKLASELRDLEFEMEKIIGYRLKIVERSGDKLEDLLTSSNPWKGKICERPDCMLCETKMRTNKNLKQECNKRNLVYETKCQTCYDRDTEKIEKDESKDEKEKKKLKENIREYKYIGETARSIYERTREHLSDMQQLKPCSHLLKHVLDQHEDEKPEEIVLNARVLSYCRSSYERQILESVKSREKESKIC